MNSLEPAPVKSISSSNSATNIYLHLSEAWIQRLVDKKDFTVPLGEKYQLHHFVISLQSSVLIVEAEIVDKPGSVIRVSCHPNWNTTTQNLELEDLDIKTKSKNLLLKSAGWVATTFMGEKIDRKIEEQVNGFYKVFRDRLFAEPFNIPLKGQGNLALEPNSFSIQSLIVEEGMIQVHIELNGSFSVALIA